MYKIECKQDDEWVSYGAEDNRSAAISSGQAMSNALRCLTRITSEQDVLYIKPSL